MGRFLAPEADGGVERFAPSQAVSLRCRWAKPDTMSSIIRTAQPTDVPTLVQLVKDLAEYEKAPHEVRLTDELLHVSLFGPQPAVFAHVVEVDGMVVGMAIWFLNYSTWLGTHGIYLEDLYVQPEFRGRGLGKKLLQTLAEVAVERGYERFQGWVLNWNQPAIDVYRAIGAAPMDEWTVFRLSGEALVTFAKA